MFQALSIAESGMSAAMTQLNVAAYNLANSANPGFRAAAASLVAQSNGGASVNGIYTPNTPTSPGSYSLDPVNQTLSLGQARILYDANAAVVKVADQMYGTLIDVVDNQNQNQNDSNNPS